MTDPSMLETLAARAHIADLVHRYALMIRTGDIEQCPYLFIPEATFEVREMIPGDFTSVHTRTKLVGREAILQYVRESTSGAKVCPLIYNLLIEVNGATATSNAMMSALMWSNGQSIYGEYRDSFRCDDNWRFTGRIYTIMRTSRG